MDSDLEASSKLNHPQVPLKVLTIDEIIEMWCKTNINDQLPLIRQQSIKGTDVEYNPLQRKRILECGQLICEMERDGSDCMDIDMMEFDDVSTLYHTECTNKNSFLYLMDRQHKEYVECNYLRRQWRGICIEPDQQHLIEQFLDVSTDIRLLDVHAFGSGYFIRWWLYRSPQGSFFLVHSTIARDNCYLRDNGWKFTFYEYTEKQIRYMFLDDERYQCEAMDAMIGNNCLSKIRDIPNLPSDGTLSGLPGPLPSIYRSINTHSSSGEGIDIISQREEIERLSRSNSIQAQPNYGYNRTESDDSIETGCPIYPLESEEFLQTTAK